MSTNCSCQLSPSLTPTDADRALLFGLFADKRQVEGSAGGHFLKYPSTFSSASTCCILKRTRGGDLPFPTVLSSYCDVTTNLYLYTTRPAHHG